MSPDRFRVASSALGHRDEVHVFLYATLDEMRTASQAFNDEPVPDAMGITQAWTDEDGRTGAVLIRLTRGHLNTEIVVHEVHHASTALYGSRVGDRISRRVHLNHFNEPFAHLHGELTARVVDHLYRLGCYNPKV